MSLEYYKKQMVDLRAKLQKEKDAKKKDNEYYASLVKNASSPSSKASYRKSKIDRAASHDRQIESIKRQIENCNYNGHAHYFPIGSFNGLTLTAANDWAKSVGCKKVTDKEIAQISRGTIF